VTERFRIIPARIKQSYRETGSVDVTRLQFGIGYQQCIQVLRHQGIEVAEREKSKQKRRARLPQDRRQAMTPANGQGAKLGIKNCARCGNGKSVLEFSRHSRSRDGLQSWCKYCRHRYASGDAQLKSVRTKRGGNHRERHCGQEQFQKSKIYQDLDRRKTLERAAKAGDREALKELERAYHCAYPLLGSPLTLSASGTLLANKGKNILTPRA